MGVFFWHNRQNLPVVADEGRDSSLKVGGQLIRHLVYVPFDGLVVVTFPLKTVALASRVLRYNGTSKEGSWLGRGTQRNRSLRC